MVVRQLLAIFLPSQDALPFVRLSVTLSHDVFSVAQGQLHQFSLDWP